MTMFWFSLKDFQFTDLHKQVLADIPIDPQTHPILRDFAAALDFIRRERPALTKGGQLPLAVLEPINGLLSRPIEHGLKRPTQKSFPHINGLYLLLRASGLVLPTAEGKQAVLTLDEALAERWAELTAVEQYLTLLETWFLHAKLEIIEPSGRGRGWNDSLQDVLVVAGAIPSQGRSMDDGSNEADRISYTPGHCLALMELFGWLQITDAPIAPGKAWQPARLRLTPLGKAFLPMLAQALLIDNRQLWLDLLMLNAAQPGALRPILQPYYPGWQRVLEMPETVFQPGVYYFKVSLGRIWRRIAIPAESHLRNLSWAILSSVDFDDDHLHEFSFRNRRGLIERVNHPYMDEGPWTDEYRVGDLPLAVGQSMTFLFDFGDSWGFDLLLEKIDENETLEEAAVIESHGEPPEQYPSWDDEDDDWD
jgi:hypothetical protein